MTPDQVVVVERTVVAAKPVLDAVVADFYRRLFAADPAVEGMFTADPERQRAKFVAELEDIMLAIRDHDRFLRRARALGARHAEFGVRAVHYRLVGVALLAALGAGLGDAWTDEVETAWRRAYNLTAEAMMAGAADAARTY
jgi:hemoglobin-like flavoprotein